MTSIFPAGDFSKLTVLRCSSHEAKCTHLECTAEFRQICIRCLRHHDQDSRHSHLPRKFSCTLRSQSSSSSASGSLDLLWVTTDGFWWMESSTLCPLCLTSYTKPSWDSPTWPHISVVHSVLLPSGVSLHSCLMVYLSSHLLMNIQIICIFSVGHKDAMTAYIAQNILTGLHFT